jgi:arylsulfatase A-like enzyme
MKLQKKPFHWISLFTLTFFAAHLYIFNEWLFQVTKPSYMNGLPFLGQLQIFLLTSALFTSLCFFCLMLLVLLSRTPPFTKYPNILKRIGSLLPAMILSALVLIMVDNFTYTIFKFGIVSTQGWSRGLYGLGFFLLFLISYRYTDHYLGSLSSKKRIWGLSPKTLLYLQAGVLTFSLVVLALPGLLTASSVQIGNSSNAQRHPHILLITPDGLDADHMSAYGYSRDTTPRIRSLAESSLLAENAFSNSANTTGSLISMYTGKYPTKTRVLYPPDILKGNDSYEHLVGILQSNGYKTIQITIPYFLDAQDLNLLDGFTEVNTSGAGHSRLLSIMKEVLPSHYALFIDDVFKRFVDRIRHIFLIKKMDNPYLLVTRMSEQLADEDRMASLLQSIQLRDQPVFAHVHLMVTHGEKFNPTIQNFSAGQSIEDQQPWNEDFYDDSILSFDRNIGALIDDLAENKVLDNTIIIIGSDHGQKWNQLIRLPLIIRFPNGQFAGRIPQNVQYLDIAPTILDYIGSEIPAWMSGTSLISGVLEERPIFGVNDVAKEAVDNGGGYAVNWENITPPFYQFGGISLIYCQKWYKLSLTNNVWETGYVTGSTTACPQGLEIADEQAFTWIVEHLEDNGFDVSTLNYSLLTKE